MLSCSPLKRNCARDNSVSTTLFCSRAKARLTSYSSFAMILCVGGGVVGFVVERGGGDDGFWMRFMSYVPDNHRGPRKRIGSAFLARARVKETLNK